MSNSFAAGAASLFGMGFYAEPPDAVPLRILGISPDRRPVTWRPSHEHIQHMFRVKIKAAHPDLQPEEFSIRDVDAADVQELVWARDVLLRKFPPPPDPATVAASARRHAPSVIRNRCPVCQDDHDETFERPKRTRGRWRGYCERCARDAENARRREIRQFLRQHLGNDRQFRRIALRDGLDSIDCECGRFGCLSDLARDCLVSGCPFASARCAGCNTPFEPTRADSRFCSNACR